MLTTDSCHGAAVFAGVNDPATGEPVVKGKTITGFTTEGEYAMHIMDTLKTWDRPMIDEHAAKLGAKCRLLSGSLPQWDANHSPKMSDPRAFGMLSMLRTVESSPAQILQVQLRRPRPFLKSSTLCNLQADG